MAIMATLSTTLSKGVPSDGRSMGGGLKTNEPSGLIVARYDGWYPPLKVYPGKATPDGKAAAERTATNENILAGLGIDTIIGSKRKKHKRYDAKTDSVPPETTLLGE